MKGLERITNVRLAEVLTQKGHITREEMSEVIVSQEASGDFFVDVLISMGFLTEWDLARLVAEYFQLPFIQANNYQTNEEIINILSTDNLFENLLVPLDRFGEVVTIAMPIFTTGEIFRELQENRKIDIFPVVSLASENKKILQTIFPDYKIKEKKPKPRKTEDKGDWENIFDIGDQAVKEDLKT